MGYKYFIMKYDTVIFDLDGTLLDTLADIRESLNHTLGLFGLPAKTAEEVRAALGNGSARLVELCVPGGRVYPEFEAVLAAYSEWYPSHARIRTRPYPGIVPLLEKLAASGIRTAIVSNKPDAAVKDLDIAFFTGLTAAAAGEQPGIRRKPAPDMLIAVMDRLGAGPENTLYVGDSEVDIATAKNAGVPCVSVTWGFRTADELRTAGASVIVENPAELCDVLMYSGI
jgi:phosphoglycolate phosphatase